MFAKELEEYIAYLKHEKNASPHTIDNYKRDLLQLAQFLENQKTRLGDVDNIVVNTLNGDIKHLLLRPGEDIDPKEYKTDRQGRIVLPFKKVKSVKDVIVLGPMEKKE